jgi:hypothetical protein
MSSVVTVPPRPEAPPSPVVCRLRKRTDGRAASSPLAGVVEIENVSDKVLDIETQSSPLVHLDLLVTDTEGHSLSAWHYDDSFSPHETGVTVRLLPGERYTAPVSLLGNVPKDRRTSGTFIIRAVFEQCGIRAVSDPLRLDYQSEMGCALKR